jgi:copper chaperone
MVSSVGWLAAEVEMAEAITYEVPGIHCAHCEAAIKQEVGGVEGVERVEVDLEAKKVTVSGSALNDARLRAAIDEAGYDVAQ